MAQDSKPAPLVARLIRWAMLRARHGQPIPGGPFLLLSVLAERFNRTRGCAFPGTDTLCRDLGITPRGLRRQLRAAEQLGAIRVKVGRGRGRATEVRFSDDVWAAPSLETLAYMDRPSHPQKGNGRSSLPAEKGGTGGSEKGNAEVPKRGTGGPPYRSSTAIEPLLRPSAASISPSDQNTDNSNGALTEAEGEGPPLRASPGVYVPPARKPDPPPRVEQLRQRIQGSGRYVPLSEDEDAARRALLAEQKARLLAAAGGDA